MLLIFQALNTAGGDNTAFIDAVTIDGLAVPDAGFEQIKLPANSFRYRPAGSPWTFAGTSGLTTAGSGFTMQAPPPPEGSQVAFLQGAGSFSQVLPLRPSRPFRMSFLAAQRVVFQASRQDFQVLVGGAVVGTFTPSDSTYRLYTTGWVAASSRPVHAPRQHRRRPPKAMRCK